MSEWQDISTAPKDGTMVLLYDEQDKEYEVGGWLAKWYERQDFIRKAKDGDVFQTVRIDAGYWDTDISPTHWQPLPKAPS